MPMIKCMGGMLSLIWLGVFNGHEVTNGFILAGVGNLGLSRWINLTGVREYGSAGRESGGSGVWPRWPGINCKSTTL